MEKGHLASIYKEVFPAVILVPSTEKDGTSRLPASDTLRSSNLKQMIVEWADSSSGRTEDNQYEIFRVGSNRF